MTESEYIFDLLLSMNQLIGVYSRTVIDNIASGFSRNEGVSQSPSINNDLKAKEAENEYETLPGTLTSGKKQELAFNSDNGDTVLTGYQTVGGELPAFDNPLYDTVLAKDSSTSSNPSYGDYENSKGNFKYDKLKEEVV